MVAWPIYSFCYCSPFFSSMKGTVTIRETLGWQNLSGLKCHSLSYDCYCLLRTVIICLVTREERSFLHDRLHTRRQPADRHSCSQLYPQGCQTFAFGETSLGRTCPGHQRPEKDPRAIMEWIFPIVSILINQCLVVRQFHT